MCSHASLKLGQQSNICLIIAQTPSMFSVSKTRLSSFLNKNLLSNSHKSHSFDKVGYLARICLQCLMKLELLYEKNQKYFKIHNVFNTFLSILYFDADFKILIQSLNNLISRLIIGSDIKKKIMIILMTLKQQNMLGRNTNSSMNPLLQHFSRVSSNPQYSASPVTESLGHLRPSCTCLYPQHPLVNVHYR